jgi:3-hydroxybutyryl-CoA dehydrogenase
MSRPERVGVFGGGRMGSGIAHAFLLCGSTVTVIEASDESAGAARERVRSSVRRAEQRGDLTLPVDEVLSRLSVSAKPENLRSCELVVEAVPEIPVLKQEVLSSVEKVASEAWLATNTSSLSVDDLASALRRPERLVGLHFFNPVPVSELVEIVVGARTARELVALAQEWVAELGKTAITVTDSPGFASSRLGVVLALEAMRMLEDGVATAEDIDAAMTLGYKHSVGPLRTTDIVGLDVRLAVAEHLFRELGDRFAPPAILRQKVRTGQLGRKAGQGFFRWQ